MEQQKVVAKSEFEQWLILSGNDKSFPLDNVTQLFYDISKTDVDDFKKRLDHYFGLFNLFFWERSEGIFAYKSEWKKLNSEESDGLKSEFKKDGQNDLSKDSGNNEQKSFSDGNATGDSSNFDLVVNDYNNGHAIENISVLDNEVKLNESGSTDDNKTSGKLNISKKYLEINEYINEFGLYLKNSNKPDDSYIDLNELLANYYNIFEDVSNGSFDNDKLISKFLDEVIETYSKHTNDTIYKERLENTKNLFESFCIGAEQNSYKENKTPALESEILVDEIADNRNETNAEYRLNLKDSNCPSNILPVKLVIKEKLIRSGFESWANFLQCICTYFVNKYKARQISTCFKDSYKKFLGFYFDSNSTCLKIGDRLYINPNYEVSEIIKIIKKLLTHYNHRMDEINLYVVNVYNEKHDESNVEADIEDEIVEDIDDAKKGEIPDEPNAIVDNNEKLIDWDNLKNNDVTHAKPTRLIIKSDQNADSPLIIRINTWKKILVRIFKYLVENKDLYISKFNLISSKFLIINNGTNGELNHRYELIDQKDPEKAIYINAAPLSAVQTIEKAQKAISMSGLPKNNFKVYYSNINSNNSMNTDGNYYEEGNFDNGKVIKNGDNPNKKTGEELNIPETPFEKRFVQLIKEDFKKGFDPECQTEKFENLFLNKHKTKPIKVQVNNAINKFLITFKESGLHYHPEILLKSLTLDKIEEDIKKETENASPIIHMEKLYLYYKDEMDYAVGSKENLIEILMKFGKYKYKIVGRRPGYLYICYYNTSNISTMEEIYDTVVKSILNVLGKYLDGCSLNEIQQELKFLPITNDENSLDLNNDSNDSLKKTVNKIKKKLLNHSDVINLDDDDKFFNLNIINIDDDYIEKARNIIKSLSEKEIEISYNVFMTEYKDELNYIKIYNENLGDLSEKNILKAISYKLKEKFKFNNIEFDKENDKVVIS